MRIFGDYPIQTRRSKWPTRDFSGFGIIPSDPLKYTGSKQGLRMSAYVDTLAILVLNSEAPFGSHPIFSLLHPTFLPTSTSLLSPPTHCCCYSISSPPSPPLVPATPASYRSIATPIEAFCPMARSGFDQFIPHRRNCGLSLSVLPGPPLVVFS